MDADLDTLATALYVKIDDLLKASPQWAPARPPVGIAPKLSDAELVTLAVMQALLRVHHRGPLAAPRPHPAATPVPLPAPTARLQQAAAGLRRPAGARSSGQLAADTSLWTDDVWVVDSTPVECGRSRETARRSELAGWAEYGYCAAPLPLLLGPAAAPAVHPDGSTGRRSRSPAPRPTNVRRCWASSAPTRAWSPTGPARPSSGTRTTTAATSRPPWTRPASGCCVRPARANPTAPARTCSNPSPNHRVDQRDRSKVNSTWNATAGTPPPAYSSASCNASSR